MQEPQVVRSSVPLTSDLIYGFTGSLLSPRFDEPAPTPQCHREWWDLCCSTHKRVAIAAPRGHAKSTAITKAYVLAALLFRDSKNIVIISDTYGQAIQFLGEIKQELTSNDPLRQLFGLKDLIKDREDVVVVEFEDGYRARIVAIGSEQKIRGMIWEGSRPDLVVGDDLENDEIVMNDDRREKFRKWILNAVLPAMSERGKIRIVGTILHMDAFLERLMPKDRDTNTIHSALKISMKESKNGWMSVRYQAHDDSFENILWPIKWTKKRFLEIKKTFEGQGNPEGYYQEYLNRPIDPSNAFFRKDDFIDMNAEERALINDNFTHYIAVDLAVSTESRRDYSVFIVGGMDQYGMLYIRKVVRDRLDALEILHMLFNLNQVYKPALIILEKGLIEKALGPVMNQMMMQSGKFLPMHLEAPTRDKRTRASAIQARMRAGGVRFDKSSSWYGDLESEMLRFDRDIHDDQVDAMAWLGLVLDRMVEAPTAKEIEDLEWEEENAQLLISELNQGRSEIGGY